MNIFEEISKLLDYAIENDFIKSIDKIYFRNQLMDILHIYEWEEVKKYKTNNLDLYEILDNILAYACEKNIIEDTITCKDLLDSKIMGLFTPFPSVVQEKIENFLKKSEIDKATDYFYNLSKNNNYIRMNRINKNIYFESESEYGNLEITINLSKPEKDPKEIAMQKNIKNNTSYPKCLLCYENMGFAGNLKHPARQNLRLFPLKLTDEDWYMQYSPYVYYNEHCIIFCKEHRPMVINEKAIERLIDFVSIFPNYFLSSNADLPIVGGSILSHDHYQGGKHEFPMAKSKIEEKIIFKNFEEVEAGIVKWPLSVIRLRSQNRKKLISLSKKIMDAWKEYSDEDCNIFAYTNNERHHTVTPVVRKNKNDFEIDLVLRDNRTDSEHPLGIFHPHSEYHNIKRENIGVIEVMGLAVLPGRLQKEMSLIADIIKNKNSNIFIEIEKNQEIQKHLEWIKSFYTLYDFSKLTKDEIIHKVLYKEIGNTFKKCLEDAGVYKRDEKGKLGFLRFIDFVNNK